MSGRKRSIAVFDPDAFYPFRSLVKGPFNRLDDLLKVERFFRGILLHDEMRMEAEPWADPGEEARDEEDADPGPRNVIVAIAPVLDGFEGLLQSPLGPKEEISISLSENLLTLAAELSGAGPGNPYYKAHIEYLQRLLNVLSGGGSIFCDGEIIRRAELIGREYPEKLFASLDE